MLNFTKDYSKVPVFTKPFKKEGEVKLHDFKGEKIPDSDGKVPTFTKTITVKKAGKRMRKQRRKTHRIKR